MAHRSSTHRLPSGIRSRPFTTHPHYPILHSLQVLFSFFLLLSILLFNFPLPSTSNLSPATCPLVPGFTYSPLYQPVPLFVLLLTGFPSLSFLTIRSLYLVWSLVAIRTCSVLFFSCFLVTSRLILALLLPFLPPILPILTLDLFPPSPLNLINLPPFLTSSLTKILTF